MYNNVKKVLFFVVKGLLNFALPQVHIIASFETNMEIKRFTFKLLRLEYD